VCRREAAIPVLQGFDVRSRIKGAGCNDPRLVDVEEMQQELASVLQN